MSSRPIRLIVNERPSKVSSTPASPPTRVERDRRRPSRMVAAIMIVPAIREGNRQPNEFIPNAHSPRAMNHLPSGGCTTNSAPGVKPSDWVA